MPARNITKTYIENGYYHIYNRGVEKRQIFLDEQDCQIFLYYIKLYLTPVSELEKLPNQKRIRRFIKNNLSEEITLLSFSLMPNHVHFLLKQKNADGITKFMRRLMTSYVMYFNGKYKRVGSLFQNKYKASLIDSDEYLLHLTRYIHLNPWELKHPTIDFHEYSSYPYYIGLRHAAWLHPEEILSFFQGSKDKKGYASYKDFVESFKGEAPLGLEQHFLEEEEG